MTLAYCPAFDFNPLETQMLIEEIRAIVQDKALTQNQIIANLEALFLKNSQPSAFNLKPATPRKKREPRKPQPNGHLDLTPHEEATP